MAGAAHLAGKPMTAPFADKTEMQHKLFAELSDLFGREVPMYDRSLLVNRACNRAVCRVLERLHPGFAITDEQLDRDSAERHGAIRIGTPEEYRWIARLFACFAMEPHNFYDMAGIGAKIQPIIATAFRSVINPEHRIFTSLLLIDYFDPATSARISEALKGRRVFSADAKALIEKSERQGGLTWDDADALIREGTGRIFKWMGAARDYPLYKDLCDSGFKIAADIACFNSHHLNHLTPNTFCMDLFTAGMRFGMGEFDEKAFRTRASRALAWIVANAGRDYVRLHFKHLTRDEIDSFGLGSISDAELGAVVNDLVGDIMRDEVRMDRLRHSGFKDYTEGPGVDTPVLLRQDAYKALTEPVRFTNPDGTTLDTVHTARFGEIEQRFYATTPKGRALYDACLLNADAHKAAHPSQVKDDFPAYEAAYADAFKPFPKTLIELLEAGLVYGLYEPTAAGRAAAGTLVTTDIFDLIRAGHVRYEGLRYEDFLPFSAAGIFASNLDQYGTQTTADTRPTYTQADLERIMGKRIVDTSTVYAGRQAQSLLDTYERLGLLERLEAQERASLEAAAHAAHEVIEAGCAV